MHFFAFLIVLAQAVTTPSVYIVAGIVTLLVLGAIIYFYTKLWKNRKK